MFLAMRQHFSSYWKFHTRQKNISLFLILTDSKNTAIKNEQIFKWTTYNSIRKLAHQIFFFISTKAKKNILRRLKWELSQFWWMSYYYMCITYCYFIRVNEMCSCQSRTSPYTKYYFCNRLDKDAYLFYCLSIFLPISISISLPFSFHIYSLCVSVQQKNETFF